MPYPTLRWETGRKPRAARVPQEFWQRHESFIRNLHAQGMTLDRIRAAVERRCGSRGRSFNPSRSQYVRQFTKWRLSTYMKTDVVGTSEGTGRAFPDRVPKLGNAIEASENTHAPVALNTARPRLPILSLAEILGGNANLDTWGDSLSRKSPSERSNEPIASSNHMAAAPMHLPGDPPYLQPTASWIPTSFPQEERGGQPLDNREILNKNKTFASQMSDGMQTAELRNQVLDFESHANRRYDPIKANPLPVFHRPDMEALSTDDMIDISFMADVFFAAHAWEFSYRLYSLLIDSWDIKRLTSATQIECAIRYLEKLAAEYQERFIESNDVELYLLHSHLGDVLRKSGNAPKAQQHMQSVSTSILFSPCRERQPVLHSTDLRITCSLIQEHSSVLAIPDATNRFLGTISLMELSAPESLCPLLRWCAAVLGDHVDTQSGSTTSSPNDIGEANTIYALSDDTDRLSRQFMLVFCVLWRAYSEECENHGKPRRFYASVYMEEIQKQTDIPIPSIVSAIASMAVPLRNQVPTACPAQILLSDLCKRAQAHLIIILLRLTDSEIESCFIKAHVSNVTLAVGAKEALRVTNLTPHIPNGSIVDFIRRHVRINLSNFGFEKVARALDIKYTNALDLENHYSNWLQKLIPYFLFPSPAPSIVSGLGSLYSLAGRIRDEESAPLRPRAASLPPYASPLQTQSSATRKLGTL